MEPCLVRLCSTVVCHSWPCIRRYELFLSLWAGQKTRKYQYASILQTVVSSETRRCFLSDDMNIINYWFSYIIDKTSRFLCRTKMYRCDLGKNIEKIWSLTNIINQILQDDVSFLITYLKLTMENSVKPLFYLLKTLALTMLMYSSLSFGYCLLECWSNIWRLNAIANNWTLKNAETNIYGTEYRHPAVTNNFLVIANVAGLILLSIWLLSIRIFPQECDRGRGRILLDRSGDIFSVVYNISPPKKLTLKCSFQL